MILRPKSSGHVGTQVEIDSPRAQQDVAQPFNIVGWAADLDAAVGTGSIRSTRGPIRWPADRRSSSACLIRAAPGLMSPPCTEISSATPGSLAVQGLPHGNYDIAVFPWSNVSGAFAPPKIVRVTVR